MDLQTGATVAVPVLTVMGWLLSIEKRIAVNAALHSALQSSVKDLKEDVTYIRGRIDAALNGHSHRRADDE